jgi:hypothetical protein
MKKIFLIAVLFIASSVLTNLKAQSVYNDNDVSKYISNITISKASESDYLGSSYENNDFKKGVIFKNGITISHDVYMRYNAHKDVFEIKKTAALKNKQAKLLKRTDEITIKINNKTFVYLPASVEHTKAGYFVLLHKGNITLFKKITKQFIPAQKAYTSLAQDVAPTFKEKNILYLSNKNGKLIELANSKNGKLKAFENHKKEVKLYVKENKLNLNKESHLIKLVKYYNSL